MNNPVFYLFFLEPYTFIFHQEEEWVLYNTLNAAYIHCSNHPELTTILKELDNPDNGYCIRISEQTLANPIVNSFMKQVRESFSGDLIKENPGQKKPYIFKPVLFFNYTQEKLTENHLTLFGERILLNLNEVTFFLHNNCGQLCEDCNNYHKQTLHCSSFQGEPALTTEDYIRITGQLDANGVERLNLAGGNWLADEKLKILIPFIMASRMKKSFYQHFTQLSVSLVDLLTVESCKLIILIHPGFDKEYLQKNIFLHEAKNITWKFIVSSISDMIAIEDLDIPEHIHVEITPYYNQKNLDFFKENVFLELADILNTPVSRETIFRREILNENFFGKLFISPRGDVYANMNKPSLGNITNEPLKELVYKELYNSLAWLKVRDKSPCIHCVNKLLCPSVSNYEFAIGQENLCHIFGLQT
jgi:pseudo-rSAM protein